MKRIIKNSKVVIIFTLMLMVLYLALSSSSYAMVNDSASGMTTRYADNTVVTKENILEILDDFGIAHGEVISSNEGIDWEYTVAELRQAIMEMQNKNEEGNLANLDFEDGKWITTGSYPVVEATSTSKTKKISQTFNHDGYTLTHIVNVKYKDSYFTNVTSTDITLDSDLLPIVYKITKERNISATFTKTKVTQQFDIDVSSYVGIKYGLVKIGTSAHKGTVYFTASRFL